jgi:hypothetical protein
MNTRHFSSDWGEFAGTADNVGGGEGKSLLLASWRGAWRHQANSHKQLQHGGKSSLLKVSCHQLRTQMDEMTAWRHSFRGLFLMARATAKVASSRQCGSKLKH